MNSRRALYGLIGWPLGHSFSARYFTEKFEAEGIGDASYELFPIGDLESGLPELLAAHTDLCGFNVTIPYKERIIPLLARLDPVARQVGAVNCVAVERDGSLTGYNTDAPAFAAELTEVLNKACSDLRACILGSGGASKAAAWALRGLGIPYIVVSRRRGAGCISYDDITPELIDSHRIIINATPLGMFPEVGGAPPIPYPYLTAQHLLFDLVYNPPVTEFMRLGADRGALVTNGYGMLVRQAELSWEVWASRL